MAVENRITPFGLCRPFSDDVKGIGISTKGSPDAVVPETIRWHLCTVDLVEVAFHDCEGRRMFRRPIWKVGIWPADEVARHQTLP